MNQGQILVALHNFSLQVPGQRRKVEVKPGQKFWITTPDYANIEFVSIARQGRGTIGYGYCLAINDVKTLFKTED